jgi:hypothetical protein
VKPLEAGWYEHCSFVLLFRRRKPSPFTTTIREPLQVSTPRLWRDIRVARPIAHKSQRGHHRRRRDTQFRIYQRWVDLPIAISKPRADVEQTT